MVSFQALLISLSSIALILQIVPIIFFSKNYFDICALSLYFWLTVQLLQNIVNVSIWGGESFFSVWSGSGYCDIMVYISDATMTGLVCAVFGLCFRIYTVITAKSFVFFPTWKKNLVYSLICWVSPIIVTSLTWIVLNHRYAIARYDGCTPAHTGSWLNIFLFVLFPLFWSTCTIVMCIMVVYSYFKKRADTPDLVRCADSGLSLERIWRTLVFCLITVLIEIPLNILYIVSNSAFVLPIDIKKSHSKVFFNLIIFFDHSLPFYPRWIFIGVSLLAFIFIGLGTDIRPLYRKAFRLLGLGYFVDLLAERKQKKRDKEFHEVTSIPFTISSGFQGDGEDANGGELMYTESSIFEELFEYDAEKNVGHIGVNSIYANSEKRPHAEDSFKHDSLSTKVSVPAPAHTIYKIKGGNDQDFYSSETSLCRSADLHFEFESKQNNAFANSRFFSTF